jgi:cell wall-associated NlpC family hydrolase
MSDCNAVHSVGLATSSIKWLPAIAVFSFLVASSEPAPAKIARPTEGRHAKLRRVITPWLGTPYRYAGADKKRGTDCSGFTQSVMREGFAMELPHSSREQFRLGKAVKKKQLRVGDLVFFAFGQKDRINHVGIYMGRGMFAHASQSRGVVYDPLKDYKSAYRGARRIRR